MCVGSSWSRLRLLPLFRGLLAGWRMPRTRILQDHGSHQQRLFRLVHDFPTTACFVSAPSEKLRGSMHYGNRQHKRSVYAVSLILPIGTAMTRACRVGCSEETRSTSNRGRHLLGTRQALPDPRKLDHRYETLAGGSWWS